MTKVLTLEAHNICRVSDIAFNLEGRHLFIVGGKNGNGKTSAIKSLVCLLAGKSGMTDYPDVLLKEGENEGWVKAKLTGEPETFHEFTELNIELRLRRMRGGTVVEEFRITDSAGEEAPEPRTLLKTLYSMKAFDPLAFERMNPKERKAILEKLLDLDFTEEREQYKALYEERTQANKDAKAAKARLDGIPLYADVEEKSASELMEQIDQAVKLNAANSEQRTKLNTIQKQEASTINQVAEAKQEIARLQAKLESLMAAADKWSKSAIDQQAVVDALIDVDVAPLKEQMKTIESDNQKARSNAKRKETLEQYNQHAEKAQLLDEQIETLVNEQKRRIAEAEFPVEGMTVDDKGILMHGLPFEQASKAQRIMASVDVGIALNPTLRLLVCENGNDLDDETIAALDAKLQATDFQMLVELCTRSASDEDLCSVIIKDGKVAKTNP